MDYWKRFEQSGRIQDYLDFATARAVDLQNETGESIHAGQSVFDRNHIEAVSRGGIRQTYQPFD